MTGVQTCALPIFVMVAAVGLRRETTVEPQALSPNRGEVLARYRHLREISKRHLSDAMKFLSRDAILHHARRLGLTFGKTLILDNMDEITLEHVSAEQNRKVPGRIKGFPRGRLWVILLALILVWRPSDAKLVYCRDA